MVRIVAAFAAWAAGTAVAVAVTWFGASVVIRNAGVEPGMPVINAAVLPTVTVPAGPPGPPPVTASAAAPVPTAPATAPSRLGSVSAPPSPVPVSASPVSASPVSASPVSASPASPSPSASRTPPAGVRAYTLAGGRVTLALTATSVQLVTAVPDDGYAVQTWSGTGWLRVDFSSGPQVSSLIASWYEHAPAITVTN
jgi:hypothetical protein